MYLYINKLALIQTAGRVWLLPASTKGTRVGATIMLVSYSIYRRETLNGKSPTSAILPVGPDQTSFGILSSIRGEIGSAAKHRPQELTAYSVGTSCKGEASYQPARKSFNHQISPDTKKAHFGGKMPLTLGGYFCS